MRLVFTVTITARDAQTAERELCTSLQHHTAREQLAAAVTKELMPYLPAQATQIDVEYLGGARGGSAEVKGDDIP